MVIIPLAAQKNEISTLKTGKITLPGRRLDVMPPIDERLGDQTVTLQELRPTVARYKEYMRHTALCLLSGVFSPCLSDAVPPVLPVNPHLSWAPNVASPVYHALLAASPTLALTCCRKRERSGCSRQSGAALALGHTPGPGDQEKPFMPLIRTRTCQCWR
jgi:hypothetical protein